MGLGHPFDDASGGRWVLSLKPESDLPGLSLARAVGNGCRRQWRWLVGCEKRGGGGGWGDHSMMRVGWWVLGLKSETDPPGLGFVRALGNGYRERWRWLVGYGK
jgi:hypothetical protein